MNPRWVRLPTNLAVEDKLPAIKADSKTYLKALLVSPLYGGSSRTANRYLTIIDWIAWQTKFFNFRLVQMPDLKCF